MIDLYVGEGAENLRALLFGGDPVLTAGFRTELEGHGVEVAENAPKALRMAAADPPDLLFLEERLRRARVEDLVEQLRGQERTRLVPAVVLTTSRKDSPAGTAVEPGQLSYLVTTAKAYKATRSAGSLVRR